MLGVTPTAMAAAVDQTQLLLHAGLEIVGVPMSAAHG